MKPVLIALTLALDLVFFAAFSRVNAQDNGSSLQQQLIDAAKEVDRLQSEADAANQQAQDSMAAYATQTANAQAAINQANAAINAAYARIAQVEAAQAETAQALRVAQAAQQAVGQQQAAVATTLAGQSATLAVQASRDANTVIRDQMIAMNLAIEARTTAIGVVGAYRMMLEAVNRANQTNLALYEAKSTYAEMAITQANTERVTVSQQLTEIEQSSDQLRTLLVLSGVLNLALVVAMIVVAIRFRPMIIERITHRDEPEPDIVEQSDVVPSGPIVLAPLEDDRIFDVLKGQIA